MPRLVASQMLRETRITRVSLPVLLVSRKRTRCALWSRFTFELDGLCFDRSLVLIRWEGMFLRFICWGFLQVELNSYARVCFRTPMRSGTFLLAHLTNGSFPLSSHLVTNSSISICQAKKEGRENEWITVLYRIDFSAFSMTLHVLLVLMIPWTLCRNCSRRRVLLPLMGYVCTRACSFD